MVRFIGIVVRALLVLFCLGSGGASAIGVSCDDSSPERFVNTCAPEAVLFVTGSSALDEAISTVVLNDLFDHYYHYYHFPVITIRGGGQPETTKAWYGMSKLTASGKSKRLFVVYNNNNGSGGGLFAMVEYSKSVNSLPVELHMVTVGPIGGYSNDCYATDTNDPYPKSFYCSSAKGLRPDIAIIDVHPRELYRISPWAHHGQTCSGAGVDPYGFDYALNHNKPQISCSGEYHDRLLHLVTEPLALQGFGIAVNANLYAALQYQNIREGLLPDSCASHGYVTDMTSACQPSIRRADYTSLLSRVGSIKSAAALLANPKDQTALTLVRGSAQTGMRSIENLFFAASPCAPQADQAGVRLKNALGGELAVVSETDSFPDYFNLSLKYVSTMNDFRFFLNASTGYAIGVMSLTATPHGDDTWKYVKLDRVSPDFNADGSAAYKRRTAFTTGDYPLAMTAFASYFRKPVPSPQTPPILTDQDVLREALIWRLKDSTRHDLAGIGYIDGAADVPGTPKQSLVQRANGNNCSPLMQVKK